MANGAQMTELVAVTNGQHDTGVHARSACCARLPTWHACTDWFQTTALCLRTTQCVNYLLLRTLEVARLQGKPD